MATTNGFRGEASFKRYAAFHTNRNKTARIGDFDAEKNTITPLSYISGTPISTLYEVIEAHEENVVASGEPIARSDYTILPPISGRDVLAVGKNYAEHAKEFNASGYDSSDKADQPTHPVIFTKRATSIIADGEDIFPHPGFTESVDYEGELGVIIGRPGFQIKQEDAMSHVWGYTIINDVTARERQRDHKQFYLGKSPDTFCPMGPVAIAKEHLPEVFRVQTFVNGEKRQDATTKDLIFSIPFLIMALSEGQTLQAGDILATGTPAGVGFGFRPPVWLKTGDVIKVTIAGLGTLTNKIADPTSTNPVVAQVTASSVAPQSNMEKSLGGSILSSFSGKPLNYHAHGPQGGAQVLCIHGLGGTADYYQPLAGLPNSRLHVFDLEGHGLSPTSALRTLSISSFASDAANIADHIGAKDLTVIAHSMGCLVAMKFALDHPELVRRLVLMGPPITPLPDPAAQGTYGRAELVRGNGMAEVVDTIVNAGLSEKTKSNNPMAVTATRLSLMGQDPEGYAKACKALADSKDLPLDVEKIKAHTLIITGSEDKLCSPDWSRKLCGRLSHCEEAVVLQDVGHWHLFEDPRQVSNVIAKFLEQ